MVASDVNLEADYCETRAAQYPELSGRLSGDSAYVSRKLVCNANLGPLPGVIRSSEHDAMENMVASPTHSWCSSNIDSEMGLASSSYSRENDKSSSGYRQASMMSAPISGKNTWQNE